MQGGGRSASARKAFAEILNGCCCWKKHKSKQAKKSKKNKKKSKEAKKQSSKKSKQAKKQPSKKKQKNKKSKKSKKPKKKANTQKSKNKKQKQKNKRRKQDKTRNPKKNKNVKENKSQKNMPPKNSVRTAPCRQCAFMNFKSEAVRVAFANAGLNFMQPTFVTMKNGRNTASAPKVLTDRPDGGIATWRATLAPRRRTFDQERQNDAKHENPRWSEPLAGDVGSGGTLILTPPPC